MAIHIIDMVGNTPLLALDKVAGDIDGVQILAKAEFYNPSGSVKDRAAKAMLLDGIKKGLLTKDKTIIDATSGNTGIAYSMFGAALGFKVVVYMPQNASIERKKIIRNYGAQIVETDPLESSDGAYLKVKEVVEAHPDKYFYPDQYNNSVNPNTHYETTGLEILKQTDNKVTHFITGTGTSGTFMGVSRRLKEFNKNIHIALVQPDSPFHGIEGTKHMQTTIKPNIFDEKIADSKVEVSTEDAYAMTKRLALSEGLFVGISSGANVCAAVKLAKTLPKGSIVVTMLCDGGYRYLSDSFWEEK